MFEMGCHLIDLVVGLLGKPEAATPFLQHAGPVADGLIDNAPAVFRYPGAMASVKSSTLEVDGLARRHLVVCGTGGTLHIEPLDSPAVRVTFATPHEPYRKGFQTVTFPRFERHVADAADMARVLRGEKAPDYSYAHDLDVQETVLRRRGHEPGHLTLNRSRRAPASAGRVVTYRSETCRVGSPRFRSTTISLPPAVTLCLPKKAFTSHRPWASVTPLQVVHHRLNTRPR